LFANPEYAWFWVFDGTRTSLVTSCFFSVSFYNVLCEVLALNSQALQNKASISTAEYDYLPFFWKQCLSHFYLEQNET